MADSVEDPADRARELAAQYGDDLRAMPEGPEKELAIREHWLRIARMYRDFDRVAELEAEIKVIRREHPELGT